MAAVVTSSTSFSRAFRASLDLANLPHGRLDALVEAGAGFVQPPLLGLGQRVKLFLAERPPVTSGRNRELTGRATRSRIPSR
ncbi:MAG TPA: hypothetical protein VMS22_08510 [Candidatus Eisenbacteria bacterium]|nr:hypothetical protein [Candidatus Eisenbacteria bacterium]